MNLKMLTDENLLNQTENLVRQERHMLIEILHHLAEINRRRLFSSLGYKSLFEYASKKLGYSEDQAYRRVQAMRLINEIPEIENKISDGSVTLTHLGLAQSFFKQEEKSTPILKPEKIEILEKMASKTTREAEKIVLSLTSNPQAIMQDKSRQVNGNLTELKFTVTQEVLEKIEKLKGLLAHSHPNISMAELLTKLCELGLQKWDPCCQKQIKTPAAPRVPAARLQTMSNQIARSKQKEFLPTKAIPSGTKRQIWQRASGRCENCNSVYALQIDHVLPVAMGGTSELMNLRLLCRSCNQRAAINAFGQQKMGNYLSG